jgi:hypothetical protein
MYTAICAHERLAIQPATFSMRWPWPWSIPRPWHRVRDLRLRNFNFIRHRFGGVDRRQREGTKLALAYGAERRRYIGKRPLILPSIYAEVASTVDSPTSS